jgi:putative ABC transport system permease protein
MAKDFTLLSHAVRNLRRRPARAVVLVAAIGLLVAVFVSGLSLVRRAKSSVERASARLGADLVVVPTGSRGAAEDVLLDQSLKTFYMDRSVAGRVRGLKGVARVTTQTYLATIAGRCCDVADAIVVAFDQESDFVVGPWLAKGLGRRLGPGEAVIGSESALHVSLGLSEFEGRLFGRPFRIVGSLEKTGTGLDTAIFVDERSVQDVLAAGSAKVPPGSVSAVFVKVEEGEDPVRVAGAVEDTIIEADAVARRDVGQHLLRALGDVSRVFLVTFGLASLLAACLAWAVFSGVANERAREVGLMRAIGATESHVARLFLLEVLLVGALGSAVGVLGGTGLSLALARSFAFLRKAPASMGVGEGLAVAAMGAAVGIGVCLVGALSPLRHARRTEPLVILKGD